MQQHISAVSAASECERARRCRARRRAGATMVQIEVTKDAKAALVDFGILDAADTDNRAAVADACETLLFAVSEGCLDFDPDCLG